MKNLSNYVDNLVSGIKTVSGKTAEWVKSHGYGRPKFHVPPYDENGILITEVDFEKKLRSKAPVTVQAVQANKGQPVEKMQEGFEKLITQLNGINNHLEKQTVLNEELIKRIDILPKLIENFPAAIENQKVLTEHLQKQLDSAIDKEKTFIETIERIPEESSKQTDTLKSIDMQLSAAADVDVQLAENFNKFIHTLSALNRTSENQNESITQMGQTFAATDRYIRHMMGIQNKRMTWILITSLSVCFIVVLILAGIIIYVKS